VRRKLSRSLSLSGRVVNEDVWGGWPRRTELRNPLRRARSPLIALCSAFALVSSATQAGTLRVPSEYPTINAAIDVASFGDSVLVAPGTYSTPETRTINLGGGGPVTTTSLVFLKDGVRVLSEGGPEATILDPTGAQFIGAGWIAVGGLIVSNMTLLEGFTLTGAPLGSSGLHLEESGTLTVRNCIFRDLNVGPDHGGGAISAFFASLDVIDCLFSNCSAEFGAAVYLTFYDLRMERCTVEYCFSETSAVEVVGGLLHPGHSIAILDCTFRFNSGLFGGAVSKSGEGGHTLSKIVENCRFEDNTSMEGGAALGLSGTSATYRVEHNVFVRNEVLNKAASGGAVILQGTQMMVANNTFWGNSLAGTFGGAALFIVAPSNLYLINNVFSENTGAAAVGTTGFLFFHDQGCNVFWNNPQGNSFGFPLDETDVIVDPVFCGAQNNDFTVAENSPCLPENSNGCGLIGALGEGCGPIAVESMSWGGIKALYR
jgi:hypothetical protein